MANLIDKEDISKINDLVKRLDQVALHMTWDLEPGSYPGSFVLEDSTAPSGGRGALTVRRGIRLLGNVTSGIVYQKGERMRSILHSSIQEKLLFLENAPAFFRHLDDEVYHLKTRLENCLRTALVFVEEMEKKTGGNPQA